MSVRILFGVFVSLIALNSASAQCQQCMQIPVCCPQCQSCPNDQGCDENRGCRNCKVKIKRSVFGGFGGSMPPTQGVLVSSVPAITVAAPAIPIQFGANNASTSDLVSLLRAANALNAANTASPASNDRCEDPCGDIKQLQQDVARLAAIAQNLANAVEELKRRSETSNN